MFNSSSAPRPPRPPPPPPPRAGLPASGFAASTDAAMPSPGQPPPPHWQQYHPPQQQQQQMSGAGTGRTGCSSVRGYAGVGAPAFHYPKSTFPLNNYNTGMANPQYYQLQQQHQQQHLSIPSMHHYPASRNSFPLSRAVAAPPPAPHSHASRPRPFLPVATTTSRSAVSFSSSSAAAPHTHAPLSMSLTDKELRCEPCNKTFTNQNAFTAHVTTHDKCSECSFEGTKKVVAVHFQVQWLNSDLFHFRGNAIITMCVCCYAVIF
jgi:hypothetical protein